MRYKVNFLNEEEQFIFFSSKTGCRIKTEEHSLPYYLPIFGVREKIDACFFQGH